MEPFKMHIVEISGPPRQRGHIHGEHMRSQIHFLFVFARENLKQSGGPSLEEISALFLHSNRHQEAAKK